MDPKPRPNHDRYVAILRAMTPEERLRTACELSDLTMALFWEGMRHRNPGLSPDDVRRKGLEQLARWRNNDERRTHRI